MQTVILFIGNPIEDPKDVQFFLVDGDHRDLHGFFIGYDDDQEKSDRLNGLVSELGEEGWREGSERMTPDMVSCLMMQGADFCITCGWGK